MKLYALHDKKAKSLSSFHVEKSDAQASRSFADAVMQPNSPLGKFHEDFELVAVAVVDENQIDAAVDLLDEGHQVIITATQVVALQAKAAPDGQLSLLKEA